MASTAVMASEMDTMRLKARRIRLGPTALLIILTGGALFRGRRRTNPDQAPFFPYLTGYVLFHGGDYKTEITVLGKASQEDPFVLMLLAQSYEKAGYPAHAKEYYGKVMVNNGHGPTNAFARPVARKKLAGGCVVAAVCEPLSLASAPARAPSPRWPRS
jgi:hypothetical protein